MSDRGYLASLQKINWNLYGALLTVSLVPAVYTTIRIYFLGQLDNPYAYSIAGQLSWVNLLYEIIDEAIILPLFFFMGQAVHDKTEFSNRLKTGLVLSLCIYIVLSAVLILFTPQIFGLMAVTPEIMDESLSYIRIESIANVFGILHRYVFVALVAIGLSRAVYWLIGIRAVLNITLDTIFVSSLPISFHLGVNGIGYSNIIVNFVLFLITIAFLKKAGYWENTGDASLGWLKEFFRVGSISGAESFVRNIFYIIMISRMVNMVGEQGIYWMANNFIWGWLLLPVLQLGELIKQEVSTNKNAIKENTKGYVLITAIICFLWVMTIPLYKPFMEHVLNFGDVAKLYDLVILLLVPYMFFAFQNICDSIFYGRGKTEYMLAESVITNVVYYGGAYLTYECGMWMPTLRGIVLLFGIGNIFDSMVTYLLYRKWRKNTGM